MEVTVYKLEIFKNIFNTCLNYSFFMQSWKVAKLVLLSKGEKPQDNPSYYRPIYLLNTVNKLFERGYRKSYQNSPQKHLEENGNLNYRQYGFRKGRSTVDAIKRVLDVVDAAGSVSLYRRKPWMLPMRSTQRNVRKS